MFWRTREGSGESFRARQKGRDIRVRAIVSVELGASVRTEMP
jgi:hypothetical protein